METFEIVCVLMTQTIKLEANISDNFTIILEEEKGFLTLHKFIPIALTRLN